MLIALSVIAAVMLGLVSMIVMDHSGRPAALFTCGALALLSPLLPAVTIASTL